MEHTRIKELLNATEFGHEVIVKGWVKTFRNNQFIAINDGSSIHNIQAVVDFENTPDALLKRITTGAALRVKGNLIESQGKGAGQKYEIQVNKLEILGDSDAEKFPIQPVVILFKVSSGVFSKSTTHCILLMVEPSLRAMN